MAGCFVLLSNLPREGESGYSSEAILKTYKEQHAIERNFGFLKDDQIVNAIFLKRPERIEALGLILLISLLIWRLMSMPCAQTWRHVIRRCRAGTTNQPVAPPPTC